MYNLLNNLDIYKATDYCYEEVCVYLPLISCGVGGVAGAGAKVTGSLGNVVAKLTFDKDHQESRIQEKKKQDSSFLHRFGGLGKVSISSVTVVSVLWICSSVALIVYLSVFCRVCSRASLGS